MKKQKSASELHENVPPNWYYESIRVNLGQKFWHNTRFKEVGDLILPVNGKVLDIGSADGVFSKAILDKSKAELLIGIDVLKSSVEWANKHWKRNKKLKFEVGDAHDLRFKDNYFEAVFILEVLEHVFDPKKVLLETKRVLRKGGYAIFLVPTDSLLFRFIWFFWTKMRGKIWDDTHVQTYRDNYLPKLCEEVGFRVEVDKKFLLGMLQVVRVRNQ